MRVMQQATHPPQVLASSHSSFYTIFFLFYKAVLDSYNERTLFSDSSGDSAEEDDSEKDIEESEEEDESDDCADEGTELLLKEGDNSPPSSSSRPKKEISHIAATAESLQPKGYTLATTKVSLSY